MVCLKKSIKILNDCQSIITTTYGEKSTEYGSFLSTRALAYHMIGSFDSIVKSIESRERAIEIFRDCQNSDNLQIESYYLASDYLSLGDLTSDDEKAIEFYQKGLVFLSYARDVPDSESFMPIFHEKIGLRYINIDIEKDLGKYNPNESIRILSAAIKNIETALSEGADSGILSLATALCRLGDAYNKIGDVHQAIKYNEGSLSILETIPNVEIKFLSYPILNLANLYISVQELKKSYELFQRVKNIMGNNSYSASKELLNLYITGAYACIYIGNFVEAKEYVNNATNIANSLFDNESTEYVDYLTARIHIYKELNDEISCLKDCKQLKLLVNKLYPNDFLAKMTMLDKVLDAEIRFFDSTWEDDYQELISYYNTMDNPNPMQIIKIYVIGSNAYSTLSKYDKAKENIDKAIEIFGPISVANPQYLLNLKSIKLNVLTASNELHEASLLCEEILNSPEITPYFKEKAHLAQSYILERQGSIDSAIRKIQDALDCRTSISGEENISVIQPYLSAQARLYEKKGDYETAASLRRQVIDLSAKYLGIESESYLQAVVDFESTPNIGDGNRLKDAQLNLLDYTKKCHGETSLAFYDCLMATAKLYLSLGLYEEGQSLAQKAIDGMIKILGIQNETVQGNLVTLTSLYDRTGEYDKALTCCNQAYEMTRKYHPKAIERLYNASLWRANIYKEQLDFGTAAYYLDDLIHQAKRDFGENSYKHLNSLLLKSEVLQRIGDYSSVERLSKDIINRAENSFVGSSKTEILEIAKNNLLMSLTGLGEYDEAVLTANEILENYYETSDYSGVLHNLAYTYFLAGNKDEALATSLKISWNKTHSLDATNLANGYVKQGYIQTLSGSENEGIKMMERGLEMRDSIYGGEGYFVTLGLYDMVKVYNTLKNYDKRDSIATRLSEVARNYTLKSFLTLPANSRQALWNQYSNFFLNEFPSFAAYSQSVDMKKIAYDNVLLGKGLLLSTEMSISEFIIKSSNENLQAKYADYKKNLKLMDYIHTADKSKVVINIDSLYTTTRQLEYEIMRECDNFTFVLNTHWEDVRNSLKKNEVAIEFCLMDEDSSKFAALLLNHDSQFPNIIILNDINALTLWKTNPHRLSQLLWKPLCEIINNANIIYFAPSGQLHNVPIEFLPDFDDNNSLISDRWEIHRLSSTRLLVDNLTHKDIQNATLYGGLIYDTGVDVLADDVIKYRSNEIRDFSLFNEVDSLNMRSGVINLPQTKIEIENVGTIMASKNVQPTVFSGLNGTEASFKDLSGRNVNILHIATHGFYWTENEARRAGNLHFLINNDNAIYLVEDKAMTRSGLLFTGANNALISKELPENAEDGVLTAKEISNLDFSNLELLVLSACQTGLGEITGDGVFGLQRGFKKAGAKSLMMSLWKVDDRATQMLMTKFYEHFLSGKSKLESLTLAQKYVREFEEEVEASDESNMTASQKRRNQIQGEAQGAVSEKVKIRPFADPKYWAAFILLDALD